MFALLLFDFACCFCSVFFALFFGWKLFFVFMHACGRLQLGFVGFFCSFRALVLFGEPYCLWLFFWPACCSPGEDGTDGPMHQDLLMMFGTMQLTVMFHLGCLQLIAPKSQLQIAFNMEFWKHFMFEGWGNHE